MSVLGNNIQPQNLTTCTCTCKFLNADNVVAMVVRAKLDSIYNYFAGYEEVWWTKQAQAEMSIPPMFELCNYMFLSKLFFFLTHFVIAYV